MPSAYAEFRPIRCAYARRNTGDGTTRIGRGCSIFRVSVSNGATRSGQGCRSDGRQGCRSDG